jgi:hypothetical protein
MSLGRLYEEKAGRQIGASPFPRHYQDQIYIAVKELSAGTRRGEDRFVALRTTISPENGRNYIENVVFRGVIGVLLTCIAGDGWLGCDTTWVSFTSHQYQIVFD